MRPKPQTLLSFLPLEDRLAPALDIVVDYSYDTSGFFNNPETKAAFERAVQAHEARLDSSFSAIPAGSGNNQWQAIATHPSNGSELRVSNLSVPANTMIIYAGGMADTGPEAGLGGPGGFWASGTRAFQNTVATRGVTGFSSWGGSVSFDTTMNWYLGEDASGLRSNQIDFYSVAVHELGHVFGFGTSDQFTSLISGNSLVGTNTTAAGGSVRISADRAHFAQGTRSNGEPVSMQPILEANQRVEFSALDYAVLKDLGWTVTTGTPTVTPNRPTPIDTQKITVPATPLTPPVTPITPVSPLLPPTITQPGNSSSQVTSRTSGQTVVVSGANDGTVLIYGSGSDGALTLNATPFAPFTGFRGAVRSAVGDFNADGVADIALGTGVGGGSRIRVLDGRTYADLLPEFWAFEVGFSGGIYLAAADVTGDGRAELIVTPDQGGGPRVRVLGVDDGRLNTRADFLGINDPNFRGGARASLGDINRDGVADLVVAAGFGGGPRVSIIDGTSIVTNVPRQLVSDFFAFEAGLRNGTFASVGDVDGDGYGDLVFGAGPGGGPRVLTVSGQSIIASGARVALASPLGNGFAGDPNQRGGVRVAVKDLDNDGKSEIVVGGGSSAQLQVLDGRSLATKSNITPFFTSDFDGVYVG
ncbi:MAG: matrixin family metalloprotease [Fimbriiglobus sp.]